MSQPLSPESPEPTASGTAQVRKPGLRGRLAGLPRRRGARWAVAAGAVVVLGAGAAAVAEHHEHGHGGEGRGGYFAEHHGDRHGWGGDGSGRHGRDGKDARGGRHGQGPADRAPAPLPALPADQAAAKAAAAVSGGKVESLRVTVEQGGGSAWEAVVLGTDGVRHLVTLDGASGTVTGNTVVNGITADGS